MDAQTLPIMIVFGVLAVLQLAMLYAVFADQGKVPFEVRRLYLGAGVLFFLSSLLVLSIAVYVWGPAGPGQAVFDTCVKIIPPILTLILGYYFGASQANSALAEVKSALLSSARATPSAAVAVAAASADATPGDDDLRTIRHFEQLYAGEASYAPIDYSQQTGGNATWR